MPAYDRCNLTLPRQRLITTGQSVRSVSTLQRRTDQADHMAQNNTAEDWQLS
jgi:hypothetical protein